MPTDGIGPCSLSITLFNFKFPQQFPVIKCGHFYSNYDKVKLLNIIFSHRQLTYTRYSKFLTLKHNTHHFPKAFVSQFGSLIYIFI